MRACTLLLWLVGCTDPEPQRWVCEATFVCYGDHFHVHLELEADTHKHALQDFTMTLDLSYREAKCTTVTLEHAECKEAL